MFTKSDSDFCSQRLDHLRCFSSKNRWSRHSVFQPVTVHTSILNQVRVCSRQELLKVTFLRSRDEGLGASVKVFQQVVYPPLIQLCVHVVNEKNRIIFMPRIIH